MEKKKSFRWVQPFPYRRLFIGIKGTRGKWGEGGVFLGGRAIVFQYDNQVAFGRWVYITK